MEVTVPTRKKRIAPFVRQLYHVLNQNYDHIIRWTPDGTAIEIHDRQQIVNVILPQYFSSTFFPMTTNFCSQAVYQLSTPIELFWLSKMAQGTSRGLHL